MDTYEQIRALTAIIANLPETGAWTERDVMETLLDVAKDQGYEQAELEVMEGNERAKALYESLGFVQYGILPNNMKYKDGTYADSYWMMKKL